MPGPQVSRLPKPAIRPEDVPLRPRAYGCPIPPTTVQQIALHIRKERKLGLTARFCAVGTRICGELSAPLLERSVGAVLRRHESLRTRLVSIGGADFQEVDPPSDYHLQIVDLSGSDPAHLEDELSREVEDFAQEKIDPAVGPLFAARLFRLSRDAHVFVLSLDHLITDGISNNILHREIWTLYSQGASGSEFSLPKLAVQLPDYAVWQERTCDLWRRQHEAYWRKRLAGAPDTQLPTDAGLSGPRTSKELSVAFGNPLSVRLRELARRERTLPAMVLLAVYLSVMSRWCNQRDLTLMFVESGRWRCELSDMIGFLSYGLHLRIRIGAEDSFLGLLRQVDAEYRCACEHQDFWRVPLLMPEWGLGREITLYFNYLTNVQSAAKRVPLDLDLQPFPVRREIPGVYRLPLFFHDSEEEITACIGYRTDLFLRSRMERLGCHLRSAAHELTARPTTRISSVLADL
jgi:hypothetical protein